MGLYSGPPLTDPGPGSGVSLVPPDPAAIRRAPVAPDVAGSVDRWLARAAADDADLYFSVLWRGGLVGQILLHDVDRAAGEALVGYHLLEPRFRGQGVGTALLGLLQRYVAAETGLTRLVIITDVENTASRRIAEKCGFSLVGVPREDPLRGVVYEWRPDGSTPLTG